MLEEIHIPKKVTSTAYEDHEHPTIRFEVKENEDVTKHLLFYKTDKKKSFSEGHNPSDILFNMLFLQKMHITGISHTDTSSRSCN